MTRSETEKPLILLVEDEDHVRRSLQMLLGSHGYEVIAHSRATGLVNNHRALQSSCLVADLVMPGIDAMQLLSEMRAAGWSGKSVLVSGYPKKDWQDRAIEAGFDATLSKPIANSMLLRTLDQLLSH